MSVRPKQVKLSGHIEQTGRATAQSGTGSRAGGQGDLLGMRDYRVGDSIRHIHWAHTARMDSLVVCERSLAEQAVWQIQLDATNAYPGKVSQRENLAWRVRIAASLCSWLAHQSAQFDLVIEGEPARTIREGNRLQDALERLTDVPLDGMAVTNPHRATATSSGMSCPSTLVIEPVSSTTHDQWSSHLVRLRMVRDSNNRRGAMDSQELLVDLNQSIALQINAGCKG